MSRNRKICDAERFLWRAPAGYCYADFRSRSERIPQLYQQAKQSSTTTTDGAAPSATNAASSTTAEGSPQPAPSGSEPSKACSGEPLVQGYDPITLGYTWQSNDEPYVDFTLSFKAPLFRDLFCNASTEIGHLYLTFTGRFAFYVATRSSGPVIGREYNPKCSGDLWMKVPMQRVQRNRLR